MRRVARSCMTLIYMRRTNSKTCNAYKIKSCIAYAKDLVMRSVATPRILVPRTTRCRLHGRARAAAGEMGSPATPKLVGMIQFS